MQTKFSSINTEKELLSCIMIDDKKNPVVTEDIMAKLNIDDFSDNKYKLVFANMQKLFKNGKEINYITLNELIERTENPPVDVKFLIELTNNVLSKNTDYQNFIDVLKEYSRLRKLQIASGEFESEISNKKPSKTILKEMQNRLSNIEESELENNDVEQISNASQKELERIGNIIKGDYDDFGLPTGFKVLDKTLWGLQPSDLVIVGARAGVGKTAFAINILNHDANILKKNCIFFSLEMPRNQIVQRFYSLMGNFDNYDIKKAKPLQDQKQKLLEIHEKLKTGGLYIDDTSNNTVASMMLKAKRFQRKNGLDLVIIDYLQFIKPLNKTGNRFQDVGDIARELKVMARQLNVPVVALCQLSRALDTEKRAPTLADLRESGEIENNADVIMFLHSNDSKFNSKRNIDVIIGKFRSGQMRTVKMEYEGKYFKFKEMEKEEPPKVEQTNMLQPIDDDDLPF